MNSLVAPDYSSIQQENAFLRQALIDLINATPYPLPPLASEWKRMRITRGLILRELIKRGIYIE